MPPITRRIIEQAIKFEIGHLISSLLGGAYHLYLGTDQVFLISRAEIGNLYGLDQLKCIDLTTSDIIYSGPIFSKKII